MRELLGQRCLRLSRLTAQFLVVSVIVCAALPAPASAGFCTDASACLARPHSDLSKPSSTMTLTVAVEDSKVELFAAGAAGSCSWNRRDDRDRAVCCNVHDSVLDAGNDRQIRKTVLLQ